MYPDGGQETVYNIEPSLQLICTISQSIHIHLYSLTFMLTEIMYLQLALIVTVAMNEK
jgi:hypothetical protein